MRQCNFHSLSPERGSILKGPYNHKDSSVSENLYITCKYRMIDLHKSIVLGGYSIVNLAYIATEVLPSSKWYH